MLQCEYCDYFRILDNEMKIGIKTSICELSDFIFVGDIESLDMEYPCSSISYQAYLKKPAREKHASRLTSSDWKYVYIKEHPKPGRSRIVQAG